ncbi:hypothetical protein PoB_002274000 [Plakobranchus ocellatus]|uniref:Uncharacterized protein n=1 Tax=Plakobranchus ocellatus TaxID=259542 RepID=A0AAV3ZNS8_9GAST|nr:hypothetical protein PoB_002274000 [Plakobranchus ocellatus]
MPGLPWSYTPSRGCGTSTGIDPSPIQRKLTSQLGSVGQHCSPVLGEGNGQRGTLMSDSHNCWALTTSTPGSTPSYRSHLTANKAPTLWEWSSQLFSAPEDSGG